MTDYSNQIGRFNSFGNGYGTIDGVTIDRYKLLTEKNIMRVASKSPIQYKKYYEENTIWVNYQPACANKLIKGAGRMINGIYKKIGDVKKYDRGEIHDEDEYVIEFKVKRLDIYVPFKFEINNENDKYFWKTTRKGGWLSLIGSMGKISDKNACKDVIDNIKLNDAKKIHKESNEKSAEASTEKSTEASNDKSTEERLAEALAQLEAMKRSKEEQDAWDTELANIKA